MAPTTLLSPSELSYLHTSLALTPPIRPDARSPTSFRPLIAERDLLPSANGSARLCFADGTEAICGVKGEVERTAGARRKEDVDLERVGRGQGGGGDDEEMMGGVVEVTDPGPGGEGVSGDDGWIEVSVDMPGSQRDDDAVAVFLAQMLQEGLVADGSLSRRLWINEGWHWRIFIDVYAPPLPPLSKIHKWGFFSFTSTR